MMKNQDCVPDRHVTQSSLSVVDVLPVFVVLGAGLALSWLVLLIEHMVHNLRASLHPVILRKTEEKWMKRQSFMKLYGMGLDIL